MDSNQLLLDAALAHLRAQGRQARRVGSCVYRTAEGLGCAFAPAIREYSPDMEGTIAGALLDPANGFLGALHDWVRGADGLLANLIQSAHDNAASDTPADLEQFLWDFENAMQRLSLRYGLEYSPPEVQS